MRLKITITRVSWAKGSKGNSERLQLDKQKNNYTIYLHKTPTPAMTS